jgi:ABC-type multidrug transport system fused ATPase/permease subunit
MNKKVSRFKIFTFICGFAGPHWPLLFFGILMYCSQQLFFPFLLSMLTGGVTDAIMRGDTALLLTVGLQVAGLLALFVVIVLPGILLYVLGTLKTERRLQTKMFRAFMYADTENRAHSGEQLAALNTDVANAKNLYSRSLAAFLMCVMPIVVLNLSVLAIEWRLGLITITASLLTLTGQHFFAKPIARIARRMLETNAKATTTISDIFAGGIVTRVFTMDKYMLNLFGRENDRLRALAYKEAGIHAGQNLFSGFTSLLTLGGVFIAGSILITQNEMTLATLMTIFPLSIMTAQFAGQIGQTWAGMQAPLEAGRRVYELLNGDNKMAELEEEDVKNNTSLDGRGVKIEVKDLNFTFKNAEEALFKNVSLSVEANTLTAFVGPSGSGKSTLLKIIAGLYEREDISIHVDGEALTGADMENWRGYFAYVDQSCVLFNLTIGENIALGRKGAAPEEIKAAAVEADADGFISALPQGYDTPVGEAGASLSGGQRQRIAIARALIRRSPVLVFDEATSALDAESERELVSTIDHLRNNHTILMITHNIEAIKPDAVFTVEDGAVR